MLNIKLSGLRTTLTNIQEDDDESLFSRVYSKVLLREQLDSSEIDYLFRMINVFLAYGNVDVQKLGYSLALNYGISTGDYLILNQLASVLRYFPVIQLVNAHITQNSFDATQLNDVFSYSLAEVYKKTYYRSEQQYLLDNFVKKNDDAITVAPTSYGKSELMIAKAVSKHASGNSVCIVVPTKSLISQTVSTAIKLKGDRIDIITHPDMYVQRHESRPFLAILTQERLIALLARYPQMVIKHTFVDESHNIFKDEERSLVLSRAILISKNRDPEATVEYFSPFIAKPATSLSFVNEERPDGHHMSISEHMKIPRFFLYSSSTKEIELYDQFTDRYYKEGQNFDSFYDLLTARAADKNIIYLNKPGDVESFADSLANGVPDPEFSEEDMRVINDACKVFSSYIHRSYNLIKLLRKGIVINHGKMPDIIKEHAEFLYRNVKGVKYIVTTSTLLEGVNVPAGKMFLINYSKGRGNLSESDFKNLIGRVGRFSTIFNLSSPNPELLTPEVYLVANDKYMQSNASPRNYLRSHAKEGKQIKDDVKNPFLEAYDQNDRQARLISETNVLANIDKTRSDSYIEICNSSPLMAQTEVGKSCFVHNVKIFDVIIYEHAISIKINQISQRGAITDGTTLINSIVEVFLTTTYQATTVIDKQKYGNWAFLLLTQEKIREKYQDIIDKKAANDTSSSFSKLIAQSISGWNERMNSAVYVGSIGNCDVNGSTETRWSNYFVFTDQNKNLMPSYAAALAKENLDNVDHYIVPFVEILNDFSLIEESFYKKIKYGTDDDFVILLLKAGFDFSLAKMISDNQDFKELITFVDQSPVCENKSLLVDRMRREKVSIMYVNSISELL